MKNTENRFLALLSVFTASVVNKLRRKSFIKTLYETQLFSVSDFLFVAFST